MFPQNQQSGSITPRTKYDRDDVAVLAKLKDYFSHEQKKQQQHAPIKGFTTQLQNCSPPSKIEHRSTSSTPLGRVQTTTTKEFCGIVSGNVFTTVDAHHSTATTTTNSILKQQKELNSEKFALPRPESGGGGEKNGRFSAFSSVSQFRLRPGSSSSGSVLSSASCSANGSRCRLRPCSLPRPRLGQKPAQPAPWTIAFLGEEESQVPIHETDRFHPGGRVYLLKKF